MALATLVASLVPLSAAAQGAAQNYPNKPIRVVVPFAAGGAIDPVVQLVGRKTQEVWGQQFVMDHRPGATGTIGSQLAAKAPADGYTLLMCNNGSHSGITILNPKLPYDPIKDFTHISLGITYPALLVAHPSIQAKTVQELITLAKTKPGQINYASSGAGSSSHLGGEIFNSMAGVKLTHVPYKGNSLALTDLVSGQVQIMFSNIGPAMPFVKSGQLKILGVASASRIPLLPDVPTVSESGLPGYLMGSWIGFCGPAGIPKDIVEKLNTDIVKALKAPDVVASFRALGVEPQPLTPEQSEAFVRRDIATSSQLIRQANIKID
ncbi:MAG: tripartite tricarboxylate transporter substrate binding protein [Burkholderiaceae bacterium]|nr:tripartite tricarboxylate transporter substrate binding protein [Burkholderiaceae bacterium]